MGSNKSTPIIKTNLESASPTQKENFWQILVETHRILFKSVVERHYHTKK